MYAIIEDSGSQLMVKAGDVVDVDIRDLPDDASTIIFEKVLAVGETGGSAKFGAPYLAGASVSADIVEREFKGEKIDIFKYKRRKNQRTRQGHRQRYMKVKVTAING